MSSKGVLKPLAVGTAAGFMGTVAANQVPQNQKASGLSRKVNQLKKPTAPKPPSKPKQPGFVGSATQPKQPVSKADPERIELHPKTKKGIDRRIAAQKKAQALTSLTGGTLGLAALATRGRAHTWTKRARVIVPKEAAKPYLDRAAKLKDRSMALTTAGAGVGGLGAFNFASYTNAEAKREREKLAKNYEPFMPYGELDPISKNIPVGVTKMPRAGGALRRVQRADTGAADAARAKLMRSPAAKAPGQVNGFTTPKKKPLRKGPQFSGWSQPKPPGTATYTVPFGHQPDHGRALSAFRSRFAEHKQAALGFGAGAAGGGAVGFYAGKRRGEK